MRRREFLILLGNATVASAYAAHAQQPALPVIGFLNGGSVGQFGHLPAAFRDGLSQAGFIEGQNVTIEYRWADGRYEALPALAAELVNLPVTALAAMGGPPAALAAKAATTTLPVVFITSDPVRIGLVPSLSRPGGNLTGFAMLTSVLEPKRLEAAGAGARRDALGRPAES
jgi:ABC-type uncharacterized transport system substrate-binding protein